MRTGDCPLDFVAITSPVPGHAYRRITDELMVLVSVATEADGKRWLHVSCSKPDRLPTWADLRRVKDAFVGEGKKAVQVFPPKDEYVNFHPYVLHLWCCLDGDVLPDFRRDGLI